MKKFVLIITSAMAVLFLPGCVGLFFDTMELIDDITVGGNAFTRAADTWKGQPATDLVSAWGEPRSVSRVDEPGLEGWSNYHWLMSLTDDRYYDPEEDNDIAPTHIICHVVARARPDGVIDGFTASYDCGRFTPWRSHF